MSIELAENLKAKLTDRWVVVDATVPELRRFAKWTGKVKTVNMNCRALVEFDGGIDISWYDIDPAFLTIVDGPRPKPVAEAAPKVAKPAAAEKPATATASTPAAAVPAAGKPSALDLIRKQQAAKKAVDETPVPTAEAIPATPVAAVPAPTEATPAAAETKPAPMTDADGKKLSPLEMARRMGAAKPK